MPRSPIGNSSPATDAPQRIAVDGRAAARMLGVSERTLANLVKEKSVPSVNIGRRRLYPVEALTEWLRRGCPRVPWQQQSGEAVDSGPTTGGA